MKGYLGERLEEYKFLIEFSGVVTFTSKERTFYLGFLRATLGQYELIRMIPYNARCQRKYWLLTKLTKMCIVFFILFF